MADNSWDYIMKFVMIGEPSTGKTSTLTQLTEARFLATPEPTVGVEFGSKIITLEEEGGVIKRAKVQAWDVSGSPSFRSITKSYYRGAVGALLVYDITSRSSFTACASWLADLRASADPSCCVILIGNKIDLIAEGDEDVVERRAVPIEEAEAWAKQEGLDFLECSAKSGANVNEAFDRTAREILVKIRAGRFETNKPGGIKLAQGGSSIPKSTGDGAARAGCC